MPLDGWIRYLFLLREWAQRVNLDPGKVFSLARAIVEAESHAERIRAVKDLADYLLDVFARHFEPIATLSAADSHSLTYTGQPSLSEHFLCSWATEHIASVETYDEDSETYDPQAIDVDRIRRLIEAIAPVLDLVLRLIGGRN